jgi:hypothetical protein
MHTNHFDAVFSIPFVLRFSFECAEHKGFASEATDLCVYARQFLLSIGMTDGEIDTLLARITD